VMGGSVTFRVGTTLIVGAIVMGRDTLISGGAVVVGSTTAGGVVGSAVGVGVTVAFAGGARTLVTCETTSLMRDPMGRMGGATEDVTTPAVPAPSRIPPVVVELSSVEFPAAVTWLSGSSELGFDVGRTTVSGTVPIVPTDTPSPIPRTEEGVPVSEGCSGGSTVLVSSPGSVDDPSPKRSGMPGKKGGSDCLLVSGAVEAKGVGDAAG